MKRHKTKQTNTAGHLDIVHSWTDKANTVRSVNIWRLTSYFSRFPKQIEGTFK